MEQKLPQYLGLFTIDQSFKELLLYSARQVLMMDSSTKNETYLQNLHSLFASKGQKEVQGLRLVEQPHVTLLHIGKNQDKAEHRIYQSFKENVSELVELVALLVVPGKIVTAICFPKHAVENKFPHVTLLTGEWDARRSNDVLQAACGNHRAPFYNVYQSLKAGSIPEEGLENFYKNVSFKVDQSSSVSFNCYFVHLKEPMEVEAVTRKQY